jgi:hypothetical protein
MESVGYQNVPRYRRAVPRVRLLFQRATRNILTLDTGLLDGKAESSFAPELTFTWIDLGCSPYQGPGVGPEGGGRRIVGIRVQDKNSGTFAVATWGQKSPLVVGQNKYVFAVNDSWIFANQLGCGHAKFSIYREGYFKEVPAN